MVIEAAPILSRIVEARRQHVVRAKASHPPGSLRRAVAARKAPLNFRAALTGPGVALIAECKKRSPSGGLLQSRYDPPALARRYVKSGAAAVSVLVEPKFFGGTPAQFEQVRRAVDVPLLWKDFIVDEYQLLEARSSGADCVLLIASILDDASLRALKRAAEALRLQVLIEVHTEDELRRALACEPVMIGINNRDLRQMKTDQETTQRLRPLIPSGITVVSESGIESRHDIERLGKLGVDAALVGEALLSADDLEAKVRELSGR